MQREPTLYIDGQPWYIGRFWIDAKTGEIREDTDTEEDQQRRMEKAINFARDLLLNCNVRIFTSNNHLMC